jgi:AraC-like DNA-binding protein
MKNKNKNDSTRLSFRARPVGVHFFRSPPRQIRSLRREEWDQLVIMLNGVYKAEFQTPGGAVPLQAVTGDVIYWPARFEHVEQNEPGRPTECIALYFKWAEVPASLARRVHDSGSLIRLLAMRLLSLKDDPVAAPDTLWRAYLSAILAEYVRLAMLAEDPLVGRVAGFIERNLSQPFALGDLADAIGLNRFYLGRAFKKRTGLTPMEFVRRRRVEHAVGMFANNPAFTMRTVAARVGVSDDAQLRRLLKRYTGVPALAIAKLARSHPAKPARWRINDTGQLHDISDRAARNPGRNP